MNGGDDRKEWCRQLSLSDPRDPENGKVSPLWPLSRGPSVCTCLTTTTRPHNNASESPKQVHIPMWWLEEV